MRRKAVLALAAAAVIGLGGCSWIGLGGKDEDKAAEAEAVVVNYAPVETVGRIEIGRTRDGIAVTAFGYAPGLGYTSPELQARREGSVGPDGFLDYDFVLIEPKSGFNFGQGELKARAVRADILLTPADLKGVGGIRIHGASGGQQVQF